MSPASAPTPAIEVRTALRDLLSASERFGSLDPDVRREIAGGLARVAGTAHALAGQVDAARPGPMAHAQNAGDEFSGAATDRLARTTRATLDAISFPRFVNELITGVFKAINESNQQQLQSFVELIRAVAVSTEGFADAQVGSAGARAWLADKFPGILEVRGPEDDTTAEDRAQMTAEERAELAAERDRDTRLVLAPGQSMPTDAALRAALLLPEGAPLPSGDPERLVPAARSAMAKNRQQLLSTMIMMGLQRIVVESGRMNAAMRFHIDTRSAAEQDKGSSFDMRNETAASGGASIGWGSASASVKNTIGYVTTEQTRTTEEINSSADLNSSVELVFRSDYVPLTRLAGVEEVERIRVNTLNPDEEARAAAASATARSGAQHTADAGRRDTLARRVSQAPPTSDLQAPPLPPRPAGAGAVTTPPKPAPVVAPVAVAGTP